MSVRNYSVKSLSKITPFPPSTKTITDGRIASKRIYDFRATTYRGQPRGGGDYLDNSDIENEYPNKSIDLSDESDAHYRVVKTHKDKPKQIGKIPGNVSKYTTDYLKNNVVRPEIMTTRDSKLKNKKSEIETKSSNKHRTDKRGHISKAVTAYTDNGHPLSTDMTSQRPLRPKSARPESRWERRRDEDETDTMYDKSGNPPRPKSARPTSRMMRMIDAHPDVDYNFLRDLPQRPTTSHSRRDYKDDEEIYSDSNSEQMDRPKSRLGGRESEILRLHDSDTDSDTDTYIIPSPPDRVKTNAIGMKNKREKHNSLKKSRPKGDQDVQMYYHNGNYSNDSAPVFGTGSTMYDLNSKIDDIDLDVDPVKYFMQDEHISNRFVGKKPSLSKDAIQYIGGTRKSHHDKAITGYHGYNQNKQTPKADITDRYHGNGFQNPQYSMSEGNQRCFNQDVPGKINRKTINVKKHSLANGDVYHSRAVKNSLRYSKAEVSRDILAKYTVLGPTNGSLTPSDKSSAPGDDYNRKPRKLDPILRSKIRPS